MGILSQLLSLAHALRRAADFDGVRDAVVQHARTAVAADRVVFVGREPTVPTPDEPALHAWAAGQLYNPAPVLLADTGAPGCDPALGAAGIRTLLFVPLPHVPSGALVYAWHTLRTLDDETREVAELIAEHVGVRLAALSGGHHPPPRALEAVLDALDDGVIVQGSGGAVQYANRAAFAFWGLPAGPAETLPSATELAARYTLLGDDGQPLDLERLPGRRAMAGTREELTIGYRALGGGPERWARLVCEPCRDAEGVARFVVTLVQEVTQSRRDSLARAVLLESTALLAVPVDADATLRAFTEVAVPRLADLCAIHVVATDTTEASLTVAHVDPAKAALALQLLRDYPASVDQPGARVRVLATGLPELQGGHSSEEFLANAQDPVQRELLRALRIGSTLTVPLVAHGEVLGTLSLALSSPGRHFEDDDIAIATRLADRAGAALDRARLYSHLKAGQERLALALEAGRMGSWEFDVRSGRVWWAAALETIHGLEPGTFGGTFEAYVSDMHPDDRARVLSSIRGTLEHGTEHHVEYRIVRPDGAIRWVEGRGRVEQDASGTTTRLVGVCTDISERKAAEEALAAEHQRLAITLASIGDAVIATDRRGIITELNGIAAQLTGWPREEALGRTLPKVYFGRNPLDEAIHSGRGTSLGRTHTLYDRDGVERSIAETAAPIRDAHGAFGGVVLVFRDVTDQERVEREMAKSSKLESIGVLAGGIAHDFNNILTSIVGNISLAAHRIPPQHPAHARLTAALAASERAKDLTRQLLTFARGGAPVTAPTYVQHVLREACGFALQGSNMLADFDVPEVLDPVDADAGQLSQVVHNLALNAVQASPGGGRLLVRAANVELDNANWLALPAGRYVRFSVTDDGPGVSPDHLPRLFDPFFTTKPHGSGLGLATSYSIVRRHGGHIGVESTPHAETTFTVHLPVADVLPMVTPPADPAPGGRGRVLVMDDDPGILSLTEQCLRELGYEAAVARDGAEVLEHYQAASAAGVRFDAVIMDLTVPGGLGGEETLRQLEAGYPEVRAIVSSGYSNDPVMARFREHGFAGVIQKPYSIDDLARVLHDVLGAP